MNRHKIVYVIPLTFWGGGLQMNRLTLFEQLVNRNDLEIIICVLQFSGATSKRFKELGLKEYFLNKPAKFYNLHTSLALYKTLLKINPDIVHTANVDADIHGFLATRLLSKTKLVVEEISSSVDRNPIVRKIHKYIYEKADKVLCVSPDILNDMRQLEGLKREDVEITYNPVNVSRINEVRESPKQIRLKYNLSSNKFVFGIISRFELFKGHKFLFEAFAEFLEIYPNAVLFVVGGGPLKNDFVKQINSLDISDKVIMPGMVNNAGDYLRAFDVFVHPSLKEPFGISIIEAMYTGLPVVSTSVGGPLDYINDGDSGLLVFPRDVKGLLKAMIKLYEDKNLRVKIGLQAKKAVEFRFLPEAYSEDIIRIYKELLL